MGLRLTLGAFRTSPINSILAETNDIPLKIERRKLACNYACKIASTPQNPTFQNTFTERNSNIYKKSQHLKKLYRLQSYMNDLSENFPSINTRKPSTISPWINVNLNNTINLELSQHQKDTTSPEVFRNLYYEMINKYKEHTKIFTDGSKTKQGTGCRLIFSAETINIKLNDCSSIFYCEAYAILTVLKKISMSEFDKFAIFSDSKSVLVSILQPKDKEPIIEEIKK